MLEIRDYRITELRELFGTKDKQGIDRKLKGYGVEFTADNGWADNRIYTIKSVPDPFKMYAITKLGIPPQSDFTKIRNLFFYFFFVDGFAEWPFGEMEAIMEEDGVHVSSKTISKWLMYLHHLDYINFSRSEFVYYSINKVDNRKIYTEIPKELYLEGWHIYFNLVDEHGSGVAYYQMRKHIGGHPHKRALFGKNAIFAAEIEELMEVVNDSFLGQ